MRAFLLGVLVTAALGARAQTTTAAAATPLSLKVLDESAPPGGAIQMEVSATEPKPIIIGSGHIRAIPGTVLGVVLPGNPDAAGTAVSTSDGLTIRLLSPSGNLGLLVDTPVVAIAVGIPTTTKIGTVSSLALDGLVFSGPQGPYAPEIKPGTFTAKNIVSITNVIPGGGLLPAGSVISIAGAGFLPGSIVEIDGATFSATSVVSANRIDVTLVAALQLDSKRVTVRNPDGTRSRYYSYLRAASLPASSNALFAATDAVYPVQPVSSGVFPAVSSSGFMGFAAQNPGTTAARITVQLRSASAVIATASLTLPPRTEVSRSAAELFGALPASSNVLSVSSSSPVQLLGLLGNSAAGSVTPVLPSVSN